MKKIFLKTTAVLNLLSLFLGGILLFILKIPFFLPIYTYYYKKEKLANSLLISEEKLIFYTKNLFSYLKSKDFLDSSWFSKKDILHMIDVKYLYHSFEKIMCFLLSFFVISTIFLFLIYKKDFLFYLLKIFNKVFLIFIILLSAIITFIAADFNKFWISFHKIFFTNDLWLLSPSESNLIKMFPENFFLLLSSIICISIILFFIFLFVLKHILKKYILTNSI